MTKLSILMLTHCRPALFERAMRSVLSQIPKGVEVIVNNDSDDITEVNHPQVTYHYKVMPYLSHIYRFLLQQANGEHIYYLEDDDYLLPGFFDKVMPLLDNDIIAGNHYPTYNDQFIMKTTTQFKDGGDFIIDKENMQLGQFIMRKSLVETWTFPNDSHIHNDFKLVSHVTKNATSKLSLSKVLFVQTTDGGDNISFPESPKYYGI
jgi:glycosyltransferase involved in cell wall biosynthesis